MEYKSGTFLIAWFTSPLQEGREDTGPYQMFSLIWKDTECLWEALPRPFHPDHSHQTREKGLSGHLVHSNVLQMRKLTQSPGLADSEGQSRE